MKNIVQFFFVHLTKHLLSPYSLSEQMSGLGQSGKPDMILFLMGPVSGKQDIKD